MIQELDALHGRVRGWVPLQRLAIVSRILLALAFLPTGLVKLLGHRFTTISPDTPVGYFFEAMYQSGMYWQFLGLGQVLAGTLLLVPATSTLAAVMCFPIVLNITVVTWSIDFKGTRYVTALMLMASFFLLCWDWDRLRSILVPPTQVPVEMTTWPLPPIERAGYVFGTMAGLGALLATRGFVPMAAVPGLLLVGGVAMTMVLAGWFNVARHRRASASQLP